MSSNHSRASTKRLANEAIEVLANNREVKRQSTPAGHAQGHNAQQSLPTPSSSHSVPFPEPSSSSSSSTTSTSTSTNIPPPPLIHHNEITRVFTLHGRTSAYIFRVDDRGWLEHLYWGLKLQPSDDMSYLAGSDSVMPLDPKPCALGEEMSFWSSQPVSHLRTASIGQLTETWRHSTHMKNANFHDTRVENASWRLMHMQKSQQEHKKFSSPALPRDIAGFLHDSARNVQRSLTQKLTSVLPQSSSPSSPSVPSGHLSVAQQLAPRGYRPAQPAARGEDLAAKLPAIEQARSCKNSKLLEFSEQGSSDSRYESFSVRFDHSPNPCLLAYSKHEISQGKPLLDRDTPALFSQPDDRCETLAVTLVDPIGFVCVKLYYTVFAHLDVVCRHVVVENTGPSAFTLHTAMSATLDFDTDRYCISQLSGAWGRERSLSSAAVVSPGRHSLDSLHGVAGHAHSPFLVVSRGAPPSEHTGEAYGLCLLYSGNWFAGWESTDTSRLRVAMGVHPRGFNHRLDPGQRFVAPEAVLSYSSAGLNALSQEYSAAFRERLSPVRWRDVPLPVHLSTWEFAYFAISEDRVLLLAQRAAAVGIDLLLLDETWYRSAIEVGISGAWQADATRFPNGLAALAARVREAGVGFGLWASPEITFPGSQLHLQHPDWCFPADSFELATSPAALVLLDFSLPQVQAYMLDHLSQLFQETQLSYFKWGLSRTPVPPSTSLTTGQLHGHLVGVYHVLRKLQDRFPAVLFDVTLGFGGKFDPSLLAYSVASSVSDNSDPISRIGIQYSTSFFLPFQTFSNRITGVPNHLTNRWSTLKLRSLAAMCGALGIEIDLTTSSDEVLSVLRYYIALRKRFSAIMHTGRLYRLRSPYDGDTCSWMIVSRNGSTALVFVFNVHYQLARREPRLRLAGLDDATLYRVTELCPGNLRWDTTTGSLETDRSKPVFHNLYGSSTIIISGRALMNAGLPIKFDYEGDSILFHIMAQSN